jgi:hypothetical protein
MQMLTLIVADPNDIYLTHHWPMCESKMIDTVGGSFYDMKQVSLTSFTSDRFGNLNSALALNTGYTTISSGVYFDMPEFSISIWVNPYNPFPYSGSIFSIFESARIIDFGNGPSNENIIFALDSTQSDLLQTPRGCPTPYPTFIIYDGVNKKSSVISNKPLSENTWQHLAATFDGSQMNLYLDGVSVGVQSLNYVMPKSLVRSRNYVGKSNWIGDGMSFAYLDDLRFYNKSLNQMEIQAIMQETCKFLI